MPDVPPSSAILRAIGFAERTPIEIALRIWPTQGQTVLQGAALASELRRMTRDGILQAFPYAAPLLPGSKAPRFIYRLTIKGKELLHQLDIDSIVKLVSENEPDTQREIKV